MRLLCVRLVVHLLVLFFNRFKQACTGFGMSNNFLNISRSGKIKMTRNNDFFSTGQIRLSIYERLNVSEKEKVDSILQSLDGFSVQTVNEIIDAVNEKVVEKSVLKTTLPLPE
jgi:hypothetical protein